MAARESKQMFVSDGEGVGTKNGEDVGPEKFVCVVVVEGPTRPFLLLATTPAATPTNAKTRQKRRNLKPMKQRSMMPH